LFLLDRDPFHLGFALSQVDATFQLLQLLQRRTADTLHEITLLNAEFRMSQSESQVAVVSDDDQSFAALVESPDVVDPEIGFNQVDNPRPPVWVLVGG
jgi:hypothetical protein